MALEDRCSPQSAPSPSGIPHSPQSTSSPSILDMSMHEQNSPNSNCSLSLTDKLQTNVGLIDTSHFDSKIALSLRNYNRMDSQCSDGGALIKDEEDSIISDHEQENDNELNIKNQLPKKPPSLPVISFSITNILNGHYGKRRSSPEKKSNSTIFRPFEESNSSSNSSLTNIIDKTSAFTRLNSEAIDYSRTTMNNNNYSHNSYSAMIVERASFLNCFNPTAYPRIHEEILNSTRKFKQQQLLSQHQQQFDTKTPPLGSLCKTVSQIGQPSSNITNNNMCISSPPPATILASSSASVSPPSPSASTFSTCRVPTSPQPIPSQQSISRDSGMESSDDTRSESGSTKDDNSQQLWPAWVYCTRYSDRPSSGKLY